MRRKKPKRKLWLVVVVGGVVALAGVGAAFVFVSRRRDPAAYVQQAVEACRAGQMAQALAAYGLAYRQTLDPVWYVQAGLVAKAFGDAQRALVNFDKAVAARDNYLAAHQERLELRLELARQSPTTDMQAFANLRKDAEALLALNGTDARALLAKSVALAGLVQEDPSYARQSLEAIQKAHELVPKDVEIADTLAGMYERQESAQPGRPGGSRESLTRAEEVYDGLLKAAPQDGAACLRYAQYLIRRLKRQQGTNDQDLRKKIHGLLTQAERLTPDNGEVFLALAEYWSLMDQTEKATDVLKQAVRTVPDDLRIYLRLAERMLEEGQPAEARQVLQQGLARPFNRESYRGLLDRPRRYLLICMVGLSYLDEAESSALATADRLAKAEEARRQAELELGQDHWMGQYLQGRIRRVQGRLLAAAACYRAADRLVDWERDADKLKVQLAMAHVQWDLEEYGALQATLGEILKHGPDQPVALALRARMSLRLGNARAAAADAALVFSEPGPGRLTAATAPTTGPQRSGTRLGGGNDRVRPIQQVWWVAAKLENLAAEAARAEQLLSPIKADDLVFMGDTCRLYGRNGEAQEAYLKAIQADPTQVDALRRLAEMYALEGRQGEVLRAVQAGLGALDARPPGQKTAAIDTARARLKALQIELDPSVPADQRKARIVACLSAITDPVERSARLVDYYLSSGQAAMALAELKGAASSSPDDVKLLETTFAAALEAEDWVTSDSLRSQAAELNADGAKGRIYEGRELLAKALSLRDTAAKIRDSDPVRARSTEDQAVDYLKAAVDSLRAGAEEARGFSTARVWLGQALANLGVEDEARDALEMALVFNPVDPDAHRELARLGKVRHVAEIDVDKHLKEAIRLSPKGLDGLPTEPWLHVEAQDAYELEHAAESIRRRQAVAAANPRDAQNLLKLGLLQSKVGQADQADKSFAQALLAAPRDIELHVRISKHYRQGNQDEKATRILEDLASRLEGSSKAQALFQVARCLQEIVAREQAGGVPPAELRASRDRADRAFAEAVKLDPKREYCEAAADFCRATHRNEEEVKWLRQAMQLQGHTVDERPLWQKLIRARLDISPPTDKEKREKFYQDVEKEIGDYDARFQGYEEVSLFWGILLAARGELDKAVQQHTRYLDRLLSAGVTAYSSPEQLSEAYYLRGNLYVRLAAVNPAEMQKFLRLAVDDLTKAKAYCPKGLGRYRYAIALASALEQAGQTDAALGELQAALREYPDASEVARELIELLGRLDPPRYNEQETVIRQQMTARPNEWLWPYLLGEAREKRRSLIEAEQAYARAVQLCDGGSQGPICKAMKALCGVLLLRGRCQEVVSRVDEQVKPADRDYMLWTYYGAALQRLNRPAEAIAAWAAASNVAANAAEVGYISQALNRMLGREDAERIVRQMAQSHPGQTGPTFLLAVLLDQTGRPDETIRIIEQARSATTQPAMRGELITYLGTIMVTQGLRREAAQRQDQKPVEMYLRAAELFREGLKLNEDNTVALNNLAYVLSERLGRPAEALPYAQRAAELMPDSFSVLDTLGWCLTLNGYHQAAVGVLSKIPRSQLTAAFSYHLGETYRRMKQYDQARQVAEQGLKLSPPGVEKDYQDKLRGLLDQLKSSS
jgi:tetratricopeptide (TPR) repeat protein